MTKGTQKRNVHRHIRHTITTRADKEEWNSMIAIAKSAASIQLAGVGTLYKLIKSSTYCEYMHTYNSEYGHPVHAKAL
jgi:hypothetical protein